jgi:hypothetical protein
MSYAHTIQRRAELRKHLSGDLDALLEAEARHHAARMAARNICFRVMRARVSAGDISGKEINRFPSKVEPSYGSGH